MDGGSLPTYDDEGRSRDSCIGAYAIRWRALNRSSPVIFMNMADFDLPFVRQATEVKYIRRMGEMLRTDIFL